MKSISGNNSMPPFAGGYISIQKDGKEFHIASVPSFVLGTDRYRESVIENDDDFVDDDGNQYFIHVFSSTSGVDWTLEIKGKEEVSNRIEMEYQPNDY